MSKFCTFCSRFTINFEQIAYIDHSSRELSKDFKGVTGTRIYFTNGASIFLEAGSDEEKGFNRSLNEDW